MAQQSATIEGRVRSVIYQSQSNPFRIYSVENANGRHTVKGGEPLHEVEVGEEARFVGTLVTDKKYGFQLEVTDVQKVVPKTVDGLVRWLDQVGVKGIGSITARKLVDLYGARTVDAIIARDEGAKRILGVKLDGAVESLIPLKAEQEFAPILAAHDIGPALRKKIYAQYGMETANVIKTDPYRVIAEVEGVAFLTADKIAKSTGLTNMSESRIKAAVVDVLRQGAQNGHTAMTFSVVADEVQKCAGVASRFVLKCIESLDLDAVETVDVGGKPALALARLARAERTIAERVLDKLEEEPGVTFAEAQESVLEAEQQLAVTLNAEQRIGAIHALVCPISILTGGPGTGKTTTLNVIVRAWQLLTRKHPRLRNRMPIQLTSPTGKASKRMTEVTKLPAKTFHRTLEINKFGKFKRNAQNPLEAGLVAVDETSMADVPIFASVALAWGKAHVLLIGDPDQLESVGAGRVFADLIDSGEIPVTRLVEVRRTAKGSAIAIGAAAVKAGKAPITTALGQSDLVFIEQNDEALIAAHIARLVAQTKGDVQVLCPGHKAAIGTIEMNKRLQAEAGTEGPSIKISRGAVARKGDKVIQTDNDYDRDVFNGDTGIVAEVSAQGDTATVAMSGDTYAYDGDTFGQLDLAYALSVHKSQGSEYDTVIIPLHAAHYGLLKRTILYTAMTRAKTQCIIIGSRRAFARALANDESALRQTTLCGLIQSMAG